MFLNTSLDLLMMATLTGIVAFATWRRESRIRRAPPTDEAIAELKKRAFATRRGPEQQRLLVELKAAREPAFLARYKWLYAALSAAFVVASITTYIVSR